MIKLRIVYLILIFHCCVYQVYAQQSKSIILPETGYTYMEKNSAIQTDDERILLAFGNLPEKISSDYKTYYIAIDKYLNISLYQKQLSLNGNNHKGHTILYNKMNQKIYLLNGNTMNSIHSFYQLIIKNSDSVKNIFDSIYYNPPTTISLSTAIFNDKLNQIVCIGVTNPNINTHYSHFRVFDTLGNIIIHKDYPQFNFVSKTGVGKLFWNDNLNVYNGIGIIKLENRMKLLFQQIDSVGNLGLQKVLFPSIDIEGFYNVYDFVELPDGRIRFILAAKPAGTTQFRRTYIATISAEGDSLDLLDTKNDSRWPLINDSMSLGARMARTSDGHYIYTLISGVLQVFTSYIVKMDTNYNIIWLNKTYAPGGLSHLFPSSDGGYYGIAEIPSTHPDKNNEILVFKSDSTGFYNSVRTITTIIENQISLIPNPATTQVHIISPVKLESYTINNTNGTQVQSGVLDNDNNIDISQLPQGLYFLQVQLVNGQRVVKKLVVNKE